jgi:hypothetical protein
VQKIPTESPKHLSTALIHPPPLDCNEKRPLFQENFMHNGDSTTGFPDDLSIFKLASVRFQVLKAASMQMAAFLVVRPCNLIEVYRRFRGVCYLRHQGDLLTALH